MAFAQSTDSQIQADVQKSLDSKRFSNVQIAVQDGVVTLTGTVDLYSTKEDADRKVHHKKNVRAVRNEIDVATGNEGAVSDLELRRKLAKGLAYDRVGYGTTAFNNIEIGVQRRRRHPARHGIRTLGSLVRYIPGGEYPRRAGCDR